MNLKLIRGMWRVVATRKAGEAVEIDALLGGHYTVVTAASLNLPEPDETMASVSELPAPFRKMALGRIWRAGNWTSAPPERDL